MSKPKTICLTVELTAEQAAGLARLCDKLTHTDAMAVLYAHLPYEVRDVQAADILRGADRVMHAILDAGVRTWPWLDTGVAS